MTFYWVVQTSYQHDFHWVMQTLYHYDVLLSSPDIASTWRFTEKCRHRINIMFYWEVQTSHQHDFHWVAQTSHRHDFHSVVQTYRISSNWKLLRHARRTLVFWNKYCLCNQFSLSLIEPIVGSLRVNNNWRSFSCTLYNAVMQHCWSWD